MDVVLSLCHSTAEGKTTDKCVFAVPSTVCMHGNESVTISTTYSLHHTFTFCGRTKVFG